MPMPPSVKTAAGWRCTALFTTMTGSMKVPGPTGRISGSWKRGCGELGIPYETLVRLPGGSLNAQADPQVLREILTGLSRDGYTVFDWTVTSGDDGGEGQPVPAAAGGDRPERP